MKKLLIILLAILMVGCTPTKYDEDESLEVEKKGKEILESLVDKLTGEHREDRKYYMVTGAGVGQNIYAGYHTSNFVETSFNKHPGGSDHRIEEFRLRYKK